MDAFLSNAEEYTKGVLFLYRSSVSLITPREVLARAGTESTARIQNTRPKVGQENQRKLERALAAAVCRRSRQTRDNFS